MPASVTDDARQELELDEDEAFLFIILMATSSASVEDFLPRAKTRDQQEKVLADIIRDRPEVLALCHVSVDGEFVSSDGWRPDTAQYDPTLEEWHQMALEVGDYWHSGSYTSVVDGKRVATVAVPTWEPPGRGDMIGVAALIVECSA